MKFTDIELREKSLAYSAAKTKVIRIERKIAALAEAGDHKKKNKIINDELRRAKLAQNKALTALVEWLDASAEEAIRRADS